MAGPLDSLADQLFSEKPAKQQDTPYNPNDSAHRYVQSRIFGGSRGLDPYNHNTPKRPAETAISDLVTNLDLLGPYEHQILTSLLRAPHTLVMITGAPGSGKSSTLRSILDFYDKNAVINQAQIQTGIVPKYVYIDFNKLERDFQQHEQVEKGSGLNFLYDKIPLRIANALIASVQPIAARLKKPPMQILLELACTTCKWVNCEEDKPDNFEWPDLVGFNVPKLTGNPSINFYNLQVEIEKFSKRNKSSSNFALIFWCAVLDTIAIKTLPTKRQALLVLDNIDPFPDEIQKSIQNTFIGLCLEKNFKIILPLRHSRLGVWKTKNHFTIASNWYPHCGPDPVEVVCIRLLGFITNPQLYTAFKDLDTEWQRKAVNRALELFIRLTRGAPTFRSLGKLAIAGSGDSIRQALKTVRFLFETEELSYDYIYATQELILVTQFAIELQTIACTSSIGLALREEIIGMAMEFTGEKIDDKLINCAVDRLIKVFMGTIKNSFDNKDGFKDNYVNKIWKNFDIKKLCEEDIETGVKLLRTRICLFNYSKKELNNHAKVFATTFKNKIQNLFAYNQSYEGLIDLVSNIQKCLEAEDYQEDSQVLAEDSNQNDFPFQLEHLQHCVGTLTTNKPYIMIRSLVKNNFLHNLFADSEGGISTVPLTLIYFIANQEHGQSNLSFLLKILNKRLSHSEITDLFNRLCNEKGRIIFINEDFSYDNYEELQSLAESNKKAFLTHSGWIYYHGVLDEFDYAMESLLFKGTKPRHSDLLSSRIEHTLFQLDNLFEISLKISKTNQVSDTCWTSVELSIIPDIIIRCTPTMIKAVRGHFAKMQENLPGMNKETRLFESLHTRKVVLDWLEILIKYKNYACSGNFAEQGMSLNCNWQLMPLGRTGDLRGLGPATGTCQIRWLKAKQAIENLLQGNDLWLSSFQSDPFHN